MVAPSPFSSSDVELLQPYFHNLSSLSQKRCLQMLREPRSIMSMANMSMSQCHPSSSKPQDIMEIGDGEELEGDGEESIVANKRTRTRTAGMLDVDPFASWAKRKKDNINEKSELDQYLAESRKPWVRHYDVLAYWKGCDNQFPDMSRMARDILGIPVSGAFESSLSAGDGVFDKYRSRLLPKNVEALGSLSMISSQEA
ncbi:Zinc finger BED domain-containing protein [Drosera capensis]